MLHLFSRMRTVIIGSLCLLVLALPTCPIRLLADEIETDRNSMIERMTTDLTYLAADQREGRGPGTEGIDQAAEYIADQFRSMGLDTGVFDGSPYQEFTIPATIELGPVEQNFLTLIGPPAEGSDEPQRIELEIEVDFNPLAAGGSGEFNSEIVFVGYGITSEEIGYDDFAGVDVEGKVIILLRKEPQQDDRESPFDGQEGTEHAWFSTKLTNAMAHGAAAVIIINDNHDVNTRLQEAESAWYRTMAEIVDAQQSFTERYLAPEAESAPTALEFSRHRRRISRLTRRLHETHENLSGGADELLAFDEVGDPARGRRAPVYFARRAVLDPVIQAATGSTIAELESVIDEDLTPQSQPLIGWSATGEVKVSRGETPVKNVLAVLEGEGPLAHETVIIGAHYDHLGYGGGGSLSPWIHDVHNGADDNGSGTTALLEVARQLAAMPHPPARRVVFIAFTGEEKGLLGSKHYCRSPRYPLEDTVAMINLDMVGRLTDNNLTIYGTGTAEGFDDTLNELNETYQFEIAKVVGGHGPSDHASFYAREIPVLFFFTGLHSDYHRPSDDVEGINFDGMQQIVSMVIELAAITIDQEERPAYVQTRKPSRRTNNDESEDGSPRNPRP